MNAIIGNKLKKMRREKGWSQEQISDYLKISQSAYARMENGESHSWASHLEKICEIFKIKPEELVKSDTVTQNNESQKGGLAINQNLGTVNQLSEKLIEQYEKRIEFLENLLLEKQRNETV